MTLQPGRRLLHAPTKTSFHGAAVLGEGKTCGTPSAMTAHAFSLS
ncbi:hypothetical protein EDC27_1293 [Desulfosoma caldarium]|uniref:Uncharacterized protein n=1 Tax=Desulfosoma caldarium TaxID=610254 RepID=A0A3N1UZK6_9BACT|nr:hypothetical protein EDC27_1293 [Desulfosoma caldarium]